ncbi:MAG TPA: hypothetical protein VGG33_02310 [Polyangia bacterium]
MNRVLSPLSTFVAVGLLVAGCDLSPGNWFLNLTPQLEARYQELPERAVEPGWQKLASEYQVRVSTAELQIRKIDLLSTATALGTFDPANPPPGFSLCHNGHCHAADGRLVAYDDVIAEATGRPNVPAIAVSLGGGTWNLLAPAAPTPLSCPSSPECRFGQASIARALVTVERVRLAGEVRDGPGVTVPIGTVPFTLDLMNLGPTPLPTIAASLALPADNRHDPNVTMTMSLSLTAALLDGVTWPMLAATAPAIDLGASPQARTAVTEALTGLAIKTDIRR